jgi:DNA invertase Pin-like site-specific DNA recombinase
MARRTPATLLAAGAPRRAVAYTRVSTEEQAKDDHYSLDQQRKAIEAYCAARGWQIVRWYADEGVSAKTDDIHKRPGFHAMVTDLLDGSVGANVVVTHMLDRFARNVALALNTLKDLADRGILYSSVTESDFDYTDPDKRLHLQILCMFAEYFSAKLAQHTRKGKKGRAEAGLPNGIAPYGYRTPTATPDEKKGRGGAKGIPQIVPEEAEAVRLAFELYAGGQFGDGKVAHALNDRGYRIRSKWHPEGWRFTKDAVSAMLLNCFYAGWVVQPTEEATSWVNRSRVAPKVRGLHEPIISQELYDTVQRVRAIRGPKQPDGTGRRAGSRRQHHHPYIAAGLACCHVCGTRLRAQGAVGRKPHYRCAWAERGGVCATKRKSLDADTVDAALGAVVGALRLDQAWQREVLASVSAQVPERTHADAERDAVRHKLERIKRLLLDGDIDQATYRAERARLEATLTQVAGPIARVDLERANAEERKEIAGSVVTAIFCDPDKPEEMWVQLDPALHPIWEGLPHCTTWVIDGAAIPVYYVSRAEVVLLAA